MENVMILGLDVGGTHTDVVLIDKNGLVDAIKVPTDEADLFQTVLSGIEAITAAVAPAEIDRAVLSTTLTTNAIVQKKNAPTGMIVSSGPGINPELYRTGEHYYTVDGSIDHRGREVKPVDAGEISRIAERLRQAGIRNVGVVGKFSVRNPSHELQIRDLLQGGFDGIFMGHRISGNLNFPRRINTTHLNAIVQPLHQTFFKAVEQSLEKKGWHIPIHILKADGGTMSFSSSIDFPAQSTLSGPAASIMGATAFAPEQGECLVLDIGGTTTDMGILIQGVPVLEPLGIRVGKRRTLIRSLRTQSIGIGGDSRVRVVDGALVIGPDRAGPAMAFGGPEVTPTDAMVLLGHIEAGDREKAACGIDRLATALDIDREKAANRLLDCACREIIAHAEAMVRRVNRKPVYTVHEYREGYQVQPDRILVLGGPAHHFAQRIKAVSPYSASAVPRWQVANAIGAALARTTCEVALFVDTEQKVAIAPEENYMDRFTDDMDRETAVDRAVSLLTEKALQKGAHQQDMEVEVLENQQFNMVRGFYTTGKNIRIRVQIKPGLIKGYGDAVRNLS